MDPELLGAFNASSLRSLPEASRDGLLRGARLLDFARGEKSHPEGVIPDPALVVRGLLRVFINAPDGRQITVRYVRAGELIAIAPAFSSIPHPGGTEALTPSRVAMLGRDRVIQLAATDVAIANALLREASVRSVAFTRELAGTYFPTMRQRLVRHLFDLSVAEGDELVARISQQDLADAVGTVREVVVRILHDLREDGLIETGRNVVRLLDPARLHLETYPGMD
jgi:CRP/FNR family transcriptional regulator, cyclic AMP receptor protein